MVALLLHRRSPPLTAAGLVLPAALTVALAAVAAAGFSPSPVPEPPCLLFENGGHVSVPRLDHLR